MGSIRYLAMLSHQPEVLAGYYSHYFSMEELGRSPQGDVSLTDGYFNLTVLKMRKELRESEPRLAIGANHLGLEVDSIDETVERYLKFNPKGVVVPEPGGASLVGLLGLMLYVGHRVRRERCGADG